MDSRKYRVDCADCVVKYIQYGTMSACDVHGGWTSIGITMLERDAEAIGLYFSGALRSMAPRDPRGHYAQA